MKILIILLLAAVTFAKTIDNVKVMTIELSKPSKEFHEIATKTIFNRERRSTKNDAVYGQFTFVAELAVQFSNRTGQCTGSLFKSEWIITSLTCVATPAKNNVTDILTGMVVHLGAISSGDSANRKLAYPLYAKWIVPEDDDFYANIAVFKLSEKFDNFPHIKPINIPTTANSTFGNTTFPLVGWNFVAKKVQYAKFTIDKTPQQCDLPDYLLCASANFSFEADPGSAYVTYDYAGVGTLFGIYSQDGAANIIGTNLAWFLSFLNVSSSS